MNINIEKNNGETILHIDGRIDSNTAQVLQDQLMGIIGKGEDNIEIDFSKVNYVSSAGLRVLLTGAKALQPKGTKLHLSHVDEMIKEVFDISGFTSFFKFGGE